MHYVLSGDTGNSTFKSLIFNEMTQSLEVVKQPTMSSSIPVLSAVSFHEEDPKVAVANLMNNMIVHMSSPGLKRNGLYAIGEKSNFVGTVKRNMDISFGNKHKEDLFLLMPLAVVAARAVQESFEMVKEIPTNLEVTVSYTTAIPAREWTIEIARELEKRFMEGPHLVTIYAMKKPTLVTITFDRCKVYQEGAPAIQAIVKGDKSLLAKYEARYKKPLANKDLANKKVLLLDIGDGTFELIYLVNGVPVVDFCKGARLGVGHVADVAMVDFLDRIGVELQMTRQQFMKCVTDPTHHYHQAAKDAMTMARYDQVQLIMAQVQNIFRNTLGGDVEMIIASGGGSIAFEEELSEELYDFAEMTNCEVLWIPEKMAAFLNAVGLDILNRQYKGEDVHA